MRTLFRFFPGLLVLLILAGCKSGPEIDPGATVVGRQAPQRPTVSDSDPDPYDFYQEDLENEGLRMRGDGFPVDGEQIRGEFPTIYFDFDQSFIRPVDRPALDGVAARLENTPGDYLLVEGYCDWKGTTEYNLALGDRRATSVKNYLIDMGIEPDRIEILSKGDLDADPNAGSEGRSRDRKAELVIVRP